MDVPGELLDERWPRDRVEYERYTRPMPRAAVNRWGDTADDQRRRRKALLAAMREAAAGVDETTATNGHSGGAA